MHLEVIKKFYISDITGEEVNLESNNASHLMAHKQPVNACKVLQVYITQLVWGTFHIAFNIYNQLADTVRTHGLTLTKD